MARIAVINLLLAAFLVLAVARAQEVPEVEQEVNQVPVCASLPQPRPQLGSFSPTAVYQTGRTSLRLHCNKHYPPELSQSYAGIAHEYMNVH